MRPKSASKRGEIRRMHRQTERERVSEGQQNGIKVKIVGQKKISSVCVQVKTIIQTFLAAGWEWEKQSLERKSGNENEKVRSHNLLLLSWIPAWRHRQHSGTVSAACRSGQPWESSGFNQGNGLKTCQDASRTNNSYLAYNHLSPSLSCISLWHAIH